MIKPGEYCATVTLEFMGNHGVQTKGWRMFTFTQLEEQKLSEVTNWVIEYAAELMREHAKEKLAIHSTDNSFIPLFVSIEPN